MVICPPALSSRKDVYNNEDVAKWCPKQTAQTEKPTQGLADPMPESAACGCVLNRVHYNNQNLAKSQVL
jgi:hypothetical protein